MSASIAPVAPPPGRWIGNLDRILAIVTEWPAAIALLVEILILLAGVVSRYAFHSPLVWVDELASLLFLWLAVLGACIAYRRGAHMRMTTLISGLPERWRATFESMATVAPLVFLLILLPYAIEHAQDEAIIRTPYLDLSMLWRVAALPVGLALMALTGVIRIVGSSDVRRACWCAFYLAVVAVALLLLAPWLKTIGNLNLIVFFVVLVFGTVFAGIPIAFSFGLATLAYLAYATQTPLTVLVSRLDEGMSHVVLLSVPLFIFLGVLLEMTGMAKAMIAFLASLLGHVRGGLSYVLLGAMFLISGISGSKAADMAAIAPALFPEMIRRGAKPGELGALLSASGAMSETIPPSLVLITIGAVTGVSIAALFTGGLLPAVLLMIAMGVVVYLRHRNESIGETERPSRRDSGRLFLLAFPAIALPFVIRAAVVEGVATATEVSTLGIAYCVIVGLVLYRQFDWRRIGKMLVDTAALSGAILIIVGAATAMAWALTQSGFSRQLAEMMLAVPGGRTGFLLLSIAIFIVLGSVLEGLPAIVLFAPLLFPISRQLGIHDVHYAMLTIVSMGIGLFTPPFGVGFYTACAMGNIDPGKAIRPILGYIIALFIGLLILCFVPWLSTGFLSK
ncbi:TRAP transporter large permease subunit [Ottowia sp.]|uniref:TRAP transporter large permease n=1 Tax=Ottowia sp. TaxID=1898956 RepID=UPI0039E33A31